MKISEAIGMCIIVLLGLFLSLCALAMYFSLITLFCAIPVYLVCLVLGIEFSWVNAAVLAGIVIVGFGIALIFDV